MSNVKVNQFQMVDERGWRRGIGNLLRGELSGWFKSRTWLKQILFWLVLTNLLLFSTTIGLNEATKEAVATGEPLPEVETLMLYGVFGGVFVAFGVMVIMQRVILGEKRSGTAAWVLSKPVTRTAFVVSRLVGNMVGILFTAVLVPGGVAYLTIGMFTPLSWLSPLNYLAGLAVIALSAFFWSTLTLMLGTIFEKSGAVIGIPMGLYFAMMFLPSVFTPLMYITPVILTIGPGDDFQGVSTALMNGQAPFSWIPVISAVIFSAIFIAVAIWRFNRQEF